MFAYIKKKISYLWLEIKVFYYDKRYNDKVDRFYESDGTYRNIPDAKSVQPNPEQLAWAKEYYMQTRGISFDCCKDDRDYFFNYQILNIPERILCSWKAEFMKNLFDRIGQNQDQNDFVEDYSLILGKLNDNRWEYIDAAVEILEEYYPKVDSLYKLIIAESVINILGSSVIYVPIFYYDSMQELKKHTVNMVEEACKEPIYIYNREDYDSYHFTDEIIIKKAHEDLGRLKNLQINKSKKCVNSKI